MSRSISRRRFWFLNLAVLILFVLISYQLIQLTIIRQSSLYQAAVRQHHMTVTVPPVRGSIRDQSGRDLATNLKMPSVYAVPRLLARQEKNALAEEISQRLSLDPDFVRSRLARDKAFVWLKRRVSPEEALIVRERNHPALGIVEEYKRFYPQGDLLAHVLGFTDIDSRGLEGIELFLEKELGGQEGKRYTKRDALGREIRALETKAIPAVNGHSAVLTVDQYLQYLTERALEKAYTEWKAKAAWAILMNPHTGEILAMANRPSFDPNDVKNTRAEDRRNRAITDMYEPGSVFKIVAASSALNEGAVRPETNFFCENGEYRYAGSRVLRDVHGYGDLSFTDVIVKSSNIGAVKVAAVMKPAVFQSYIEKYGFGRRTSVDLPGEAAGFVRPPGEWSLTSPYNIPMGHEILVTALQMVRALAVIANGGHLVTPYIVSRIQDEAGVVLKENKPKIIRRVIASDTAEKMRDILVQVVERGTGKRAKMDSISAGGKTGTAQKVLPGGKGYSHNNFIGSFIGFAPAENPRVVMIIVLDDPKPRYYGGTVAAPVFKEVIEAGLFHMGYVPEDAERLTMPAISDGQTVPENPPIPQ